MTVEDLIASFRKLDAEMGRDLLCVVAKWKGHGNFGPGSSNVFDLGKDIWRLEGPTIRVVDRTLGPHTLRVFSEGKHEAHHQMKFWAGHSLTWLKKNAAAAKKLHSAVPYETAPIVEVSKIDAAATWCVLGTAASVGGIFGDSMAPAVQSMHTMRFAGKSAPPDVSWVRMDWKHPFEMSAALLEVLSGQRAQRIEAILKASPPILDPFGLPEEIVQAFRVFSFRYCRLDRFQRGVFEFWFAIGFHSRYISIALAHPEDERADASEVFARNFVLFLQRGRDAVLSLVTPTERIEPAARMQRAIDAVMGVLDAYQTVPIDQIVNREGRSLRPGPWFNWFLKIERESNDVIGLLTLAAPDSQSSHPMWTDRLSPGAKRLWDYLPKRCMQARDLAKPEALNTSEQTIREQVKEIRGTSQKPTAVKNRGSFGYYRPDEPPDWTKLKPKRKRRIGRS